MNSSGGNIITDFKKANPQAFKRIFDLYYSKVRYFAFKLTANKEDAEDITLESFAKLFERYKDFETEANIKAFLFIATRNACFNFLKYQQKIQTGQKELRYLQQDDYADAEVIESEVIHLLYTAIESLPTERKKIFKLLYLDGMKLADVAEQLGISINTVKSQRAKAIIALQGIISNKQLGLLLVLSTASTTHVMN